MLEDTLVEEDIHPQYVSAGITDLGRVRASNEDAFAVFDHLGLWVVADGMGGYRDGDVASRMVCESLASLQGFASLDEGVDQVRQRLGAVNRRLYAAGTRIVNPIISGSTVATLIVRRTACAVLWAGDSRVYRLREGKLAQLTSDHTWAAELNLQNPNEETEHAITRAVGGEDTLALDVRRERVKLGDRFLLCSDGLTREVDDARIATLLGTGSVRDAAGALIAATLAAGARDNVTAVVVEAT